MKENALILFFKYPRKGEVKTRLSRILDEGFVYNLYRHFISDLLTTCRSVKASIVLALDGIDNNEYSEYAIIKQRGPDIGVRMFNAFSDVFAMGYSNAVLIGSDIPDINDNLLNQAFESLSRDSIVLGPSSDGGYYLIGFQYPALSQEVFNDIPWSTIDTYAVTLDRLKNITDSFYILNEFNDIDTFEDLKRFYKNNKHRGKISATIKFLSENEEILYEKI